MSGLVRSSHLPEHPDGRRCASRPVCCGFTPHLPEALGPATVCIAASLKWLHAHLPEAPGQTPVPDCQTIWQDVGTSVLSVTHSESRMAGICAIIRIKDSGWERMA